MIMAVSDVALCWGHLGVELVGLLLAQGDHLVELGAERVGRLGRLGAGGAEAQPQLHRGARLDRDLVPERGLRAVLVRVDRRRAGHDVVVDPVLRIRRGRRCAVQPGVVGLVLAEQRGRRRTVRARPGQQLQVTEERVVDADGAVVPPPQARLGGVDVPGPGVAEPGGRQDVERVGVGAGVGDPDRHQQVGRGWPWRSPPRRSSTGPRRTRRCPTARTPGRACPAARSRRSGRRRGRRACG